DEQTGPVDAAAALGRRRRIGAARRVTAAGRPGADVAASPNRGRANQIVRPGARRGRAEAGAVAGGGGGRGGEGDRRFGNADTAVTVRVAGAEARRSPGVFLPLSPKGRGAGGEGTA